MPKSTSLTILCAIICLLLSGCWDRRELNQLGITSATGVDWSDGRWIMTYQVVVPSGMWPGGGGSGGGTSQSTVHVFSSEGRTIREAASRSNLDIPRQLYFSHTDTIIIGKSAAEHGLSEVLELYLRSVEARETVLMAVTEERASDVLKLFVPLEKVPGVALNRIMAKDELNSGFYPTVRLFDFARALYSDSRAIGVPEINPKGKPNVKSRKEMASLDMFKQTFSDTKLALTGQSVFIDARRIGRLDLRESYGIAWLSDKVKRSSVAVHCPAGSDPSALSTFRIEKAKTKVTPLKGKDGFRILVQVSVSGELMESDCKLDLTKNEAIRKLGGMIEKEIEDILETGWNALKRLKADLPEFADKIHRKYPSDWRKMKDTWPERFVTLEIDPQVRVSVIRIGLSQKPIKLDRSHAKG